MDFELRRVLTHMPLTLFKNHLCSPLWCIASHHHGLFHHWKFLPFDSLSLFHLTPILQLCVLEDVWFFKIPYTRSEDSFMTFIWHFTWHNTQGLSLLSQMAIFPSYYDWIIFHHTHTHTHMPHFLYLFMKW